MFELKPTTIGTVIKSVGNASTQLVKSLSDANGAQKVIVGQQQGLVIAIGGATIAMGAIYIHKRFIDDSHDVIEVDSERDELRR